MSIFFTLAGVALIPVLLTTLFPNRKEFFERAEVKGFGLGVYLILVVILLRESLELEGATTTFLSFGAGLFLSLVIGFIFKEFHHHHSSEETEEHHNRASAWRILTSDFFHNIVDGIAIIAGFAISPSVGVISFLGVLGHQIIQQAGQQILLVESGIKPKRAIFISMVVSLSIFLGYLVGEGSQLEAIFIALSGGIVSWKVSIDILEAKWTKKMALGFALGAFILAAILLLVPHTHESEEEHFHEHDHEHELELML